LLVVWRDQIKTELYGAWLRRALRSARFEVHGDTRTECGVKCSVEVVEAAGMKDDGREVRRVSGHSHEPAIQVICLVSRSWVLSASINLLDKEGAEQQMKEVLVPKECNIRERDMSESTC
jgi:hypothetical protein